jgi:molecular chaperone DnaK (HSP70)
MKDAESLGISRFDQILLVGGSTRMPQVSERLKTEFGLPLRMFDPDEAVAKGAAVYGQKLAIDEQIQAKIAEIAGTSSTGLDISNVAEKVIVQAQKKVAQSIGLKAEAVQKISQQRITNVSSHSFGVVVIKEDEKTGTQAEVISNLVLLNQPLPTSQSRCYKTLQANQERVEIKIMENTSKEEFVDDLFEGVEIGNVVLPLPPRSPAGTPIEVIFQLNQEGRLHVIGCEPASDRAIETDIYTHQGIAEKEFNEAKNRFNRLIIS